MRGSRERAEWPPPGQKRAQAGERGGTQSSTKVLIRCFCLGTLEFEVSFRWPKGFLEPPVKVWSNIKTDEP